MKSPFLMYVQTFYTDDAVIAEGTLHQGAVAVGEPVQVVDLDRRSVVARVTKVDVNGANLRVTLEGLSGEWKYGWIIAPPEVYTFHKRFRADVTLVKTEEGGRRKPLVLVTGYAPLPSSSYESMRLKIYGANLHCFPEFPHPDLFDYLEAAPGETVKLNITATGAVPARVGHQFQLLEGQQDVIAVGTVTDLLD